MRDPKYIVKENVVNTTLGDEESVLLDLKTRRYYSLNETGTRIWEQLAGGASISEIIEQITSKYDVSPEDARHHVEVLISELAAERLIEEHRKDG